jgi:pimeloyl-ACP methyl ester carboxylesterase
LGELMMFASRSAPLDKALNDLGMPSAVAAHEANQLNLTMRQCILALYRSAVHVGKEWAGPDGAMPPRGLVIWGDADPFVGFDVAQRFCERHGVPLHREAGAGHWAMIERPASVAEALIAHWA